MFRQTSYKLAKYTSWIIVLLGILLPFLGLLLDGNLDWEVIVFVYVVYTDAAPFLICPSILFLIVLGITKRWERTFKPLLILFVVTLASFMFYEFYLYSLGRLESSLFAFVAFGISIVTLIESIILFASKD